MVEDVPGFQPELNPPRAADREHAEDREVEVVSARPAELIAARRSETHAGRLAERVRVEPRAGRADLAHYAVCAIEVCRLRIGGRVERRPARSDCERRAAECRD